MTSAERLAQYEDLFNKSQSYDTSRFQTDFEKSYGEATNYNKDLIEQQSNAMGKLQAVAPEMSQRYSQGLIMDPTTQRNLIAQARQTPIADYSTAVGLLGQRGQRYSDILGKSLGGYESEAQRAGTAAENAWRLYQDILAQEEASRARASSGGGSSIADLIGALYGGQSTQTQQQVQPQATTTPKYWNTLTKAAQWEPENKTLANLYNNFTNTTGKFIYENPSPIAYIKNLFNRDKK